MPDVIEDQEERLLRRARGGDGEAIDLLSRRYDRLARSIANRFAVNRMDRDDALQVARCALLGALRRFDPERGVRFSTYAYSTIVGELKKTSRTTRWAVHLPRQVQEAYLDVAQAEELAVAELRRAPSTSELAALVDRPAREVDAVRTLGRLHSASPLPDVAEGDHRQVLGIEDDGFGQVERRAVVERTLRRLPPKLRGVLELRYLDGLSQAEIGRRTGLSQRQVSRLLRAAVRQARVVAGDG